MKNLAQFSAEFNSVPWLSSKLFHRGGSFTSVCTEGRFVGSDINGLFVMKRDIIFRIRVVLIF